MADIIEKFKLQLKKDGFSWTTAAERAGITDRANFRRKVIGLLKKTSNILDSLGYELVVTKKKKK